MAGIKCNISLHSSQQMGADKEENFETYEGSYVDRDSKKYISYIRKVEDGKIDCLISYDRKSLSMTQKGALNSKLQLIPGKETSNVYGTPMGDLTLSIFTHHYQVIEQAGSTKLIIDYSILAGDAPIQTAMEIEIKY
jgi:uncharacterized beta-barrel protein YwiB (DUF1934 family)